MFQIAFCKAIVIKLNANVTGVYLERDVWMFLAIDSINEKPRVDVQKQLTQELSAAFVDVLFYPITSSV